MADLQPDDLPAAVKSRFADDDAAQAAINTALVAARRYCGWHVSPVRTETVEVDGPGGRVLSLPTLQLISVGSVVEHNTAVDVATLDRSRRKGTLSKPYGCWSSRDGAIEVVMTHGYTEEQAPDWRTAILSVVDKRSQHSNRDSGDLKRKKVGEVEYEWFETLLSANDELAVQFAQFRILPSP